LGTDGIEHYILSSEKFRIQHKVIRKYSEFGRNWTLSLI